MPCIATGQPLTIHQTDHFDVTHTPLSCTAAPIYDTRGEFAAVLDISLLSSAIAEASQNLSVAAAYSEGDTIGLADLPPDPGRARGASTEAETLRAVLARCHGNVSEAARQLRVDRTTVHRRMRRLGIVAH